MNNQAEVCAAMQGIDDVMNEMWNNIRDNDIAPIAEKVEATHVLNVTEAHASLIESLKFLRDAYKFHTKESPKTVNELDETSPGTGDVLPDGTGPMYHTADARNQNCIFDGARISVVPLEQQHPSND